MRINDYFTVRPRARRRGEEPRAYTKGSLKQVTCRGDFLAGTMTGHVGTFLWRTAAVVPNMV
jgi:hypothetical protein